MKESEYNRLKAQIEAEHRKKLEALEMVWKMSGGYSTPKVVSFTTVKTSMGNAASVATGLGDAVKHAVAQQTGDFDIFEVERSVKDKMGPVRRRSIAAALRRLVEMNQIKITVPSSGRRATIYQKA